METMDGMILVHERHRQEVDMIMGTEANLLANQPVDPIHFLVKAKHIDAHSHSLLRVGLSQSNDSVICRRKSS